MWNWYETCEARCVESGGDHESTSNIERYPAHDGSSLGSSMGRRWTQDDALIAEQYLDSVVKTKITAMLDADADNLTSDDLAAKRPGRTNIATATIAATTTSRLKTGTSSTWKSTTPTWPVRVSGTLPCHLARWR